MFFTKMVRRLSGSFLGAALLLSGNSIAESATSRDDLHAGIGFLAPFNTHSVGYLQFYSVFDFHEIDGIRFSAGPHLGLGFAKEFFMVDLDAFLRGAHRFVLPKDYLLDLYIRVPVGLSVASVGAFAMGFNVGFIPGVELFFKPRVGVFMEAGFFHHSLFPFNLPWVFHEPTFHFNVGLSFKL